MPIELVMTSNHHMLSPSPSAFIFPSIRVFTSESVLCSRWPKHWSLSFSISPSNEYSGWFPLGWTDLLAVQGTLKHLLQHHSSKASVLRCSAFFMSCSHICSSSSLAAKSSPTLAIPWTVALQVPLSMGFSRRQYWSGLPFPSPGSLPNPGIKSGSPALQADSLPTELQGKLS